MLRAYEISLENRLPLVFLVESGGADLPRQAEVFLPGGAMFRNLTRTSAARVPTISLVFGNSTAGGAYLPGMSDYVVMVKERAKVFLGGPPLVKMATGEERERRGARRRRDARARLGARRLHGGRRARRAAPRPPHRRAARLAQARAAARARRAREPLYDPDELLGVASADLKVPFPIREVIARLVDGSEFDEFKPLYGTNLVTGWARLHGYDVGILANDQGVLFSEEAQKAAQFIQLANKIDVPLRLPAERDRLHGRQEVRAGRHHQARLDDGERGLEQRRAAPDAPGRRLLRRRQLRHERARLQAALPVPLAEREDRGDGPRAARRHALDRGAAGRGGGGPALRRGGRREAATR